MKKPKVILGLSLVCAILFTYAYTKDRLVRLEIQKRVNDPPVSINIPLDSLNEYDTLTLQY